MAVAAGATKAAAALGGGGETLYTKPSEDGPEVAAVLAATQNMVDNCFATTGHKGQQNFNPKSDGSVVVGIIAVPAGGSNPSGTTKLTAIWWPNNDIPTATSGTWEGATWR